ncbi:CRM-domain containing factor CFM2, chloroplastic-like protein [Drosera capensis]
MSLSLFHHHTPPPLLPKTLTNPLSLSLTLPPPRRLPQNPNSTPNCTTTFTASPIQRIADKLRSLGYIDSSATDTAASQSSSAGEIFLPDPRDLPALRVGHTIDPSWAGTGKETDSEDERRERGLVMVAEGKLERERLSRLRREGIGLKRGVKVGKAGVTEGVVNGIHERWRGCEVVKVVVEDVWGLNMKRTHELLEKKTGGMVVWRSGSKLVLYRGADYKFPYFSLDGASIANNQNLEDELLEYNEEDQSSVSSSGPNLTRKLAQSSLVHGVGHPNKVRPLMPGEKQIADEADRLLDGLGPRFADWWGNDPLPVDADLLPVVVPGYRRPFRLLPYAVKPGLTNDEMNTLKRLGRPLPCHFAVGRTKDLQGLAAAIAKLWEKSELAKVAVKRGVNMEESKLIAEELKLLTGGLLLSRDEDCLVLYRGKDFLPRAVSIAIEERRKHQMHVDEEWIDDGSFLSTTTNSALETSEQGSVSNVRKDKEGSYINLAKIMNANIIVAGGEGIGTEMLSAASLEKVKAAEVLEESELANVPQETEMDEKGITEEERYMLKKVGLKMKPFLLLGKRGVFDGTVQNMHLHWKYRELVKLIHGGESIDEAQRTAEILEAESGGILVAVEKVSKGFAIIVYRGRNYSRPASLKPKTLLNKREAMRRAIVAQRHASLNLDVLKPPENQEELQSDMINDKDTSVGCQKASRNEKQVAVSSTSMVDSTEAAMSSSPGSLHLENRPSTVYDSQKDAGLGYIRQHDDSELKQQAGELTITRHGLQDFGSDPAVPSLVNLTQENMEQRGFRSETETMEMVGESAKRKLNPSPNTDVVDVNNDVRPRAAPLTNKERLLLRKEALLMKKRPLLAVDGKNMITGVAKAIKAHFKKYPFAIVNVKGRVKGSSVRELALKLEEATGAVLVSQELCNVILYRGWGAGLGAGITDSTKDIADERNGGSSIPVSPELIAAIKLECGLVKDIEKATLKTFQEISIGQDKAD